MTFLGGKPLAVVEAKKTLVDARAGQEQAKLYADALEKVHGQRPMIFYTNGHDIWVWDDAVGYPPRSVFGFFSKDTLQYRVGFQRKEKLDLLKDVRPDPNIAGYLHQLESITRKAFQEFDPNHPVPQPLGPIRKRAQLVDGAAAQQAVAYRRTADAMAKCCAPLLSAGSHIKLIDPYLDANNGRHRRPLVEFLRCVRPGARVDVFCGDGKGQDHLCRGIERALEAVRPEGVEVRLYLRPQETLHNRYVLTQGGGLFFSTGLDDHDDGENRTDEIGVLEPAIWSVQWAKYSGDDPVACWR